MAKAPQAVRPHKKRLFGNLRPGLVLLIIPVVVGLVVVFLIFGGSYDQILGKVGARRLTTQNWEYADQAFKRNQPTYERKFAYYKLRERQDLHKVAEFFSVDEQGLTQLNPGTLVANTTIKVTPVQFPLAETAGPNGKIFGAKVVEREGIIHVTQDYKFDQAVTNLPELAKLLRNYNAITEIEPGIWRINRPVSVEDNIRIDITPTTAKRVELRSQPNDVVCLCFDGAAALIKGVTVTSIDPTTGKPDTNPDDQRSFVRAKSGRLDVINSTVSYLGNGLNVVQTEAQKPAMQRDGGTYGISWRIPDDKLGLDISTGWVENSTFYHNHFGSYTFGASGMTWRNNHFLQNDVYGLDPHDDSNNALIEGNVFEHNGKHGFIVSKRCDYNIIRNNTSFGNKLHGFMLHQDSAFNVIENNVSYDNVDNYVVYGSDFNTIRNNVSYNARSSHMRINQGARNTYVTGNKFYGGRRGIYVYGNSQNVYAANNDFQQTKEVLTTDGAQNVVFVNNTLHALLYKIPPNDRMIFGPNTVAKKPIAIPAKPDFPDIYTTKTL